MKLIWADRIAIGVLALALAFGAITFFNNRSLATSDAARIAESDARCAKTPLANDAFGAAFSCKALRDTPLPQPTADDVANYLKGALGYTLGLWFVLRVLDFMANGSARRG